MKNNSGFTTMELLTVIAIIGIIAAIAVPNLFAWRSNQQLNGSAREVLSFINGAKIEAIKNNANVDIAIDATDQKITSRYTNRAIAGSPPVEKELTLKPGIYFFGSDKAFSFNSRGVPDTVANDTFTLTRANGDKRSVVMAVTGITRIE